MNPRRFVQVDVFGAGWCRGNPLAVVVDADGMADADMAALARWTNLSETAFLLPPTDPAADYRVRIFTPAGELPFAGHPTLGSAWAWLGAGGRPGTDGVVVQQCGIGLVRVRVDGDTAWFVAPECLRRGPASAGEASAVAAALGLAPEALEACEWVDNGPGWIGARVADLDALYAITPRASDLAIGVAAPADDGSAYHVRAFTRGTGGPVEDPVTGSLNASVAQWWVRRGWAVPPYTVRQGRGVGADGVVEITRDDAGALWVGGRVRAVIRGTVAL